MKKILPLLLLLVGATAAIAFLLFEPVDRINEDRRLTVVATIVPVATLAEEIGGEHVNVITLVPPGASPHSYEPTPDQLRQIADADLLLAVGTPVEFEVAWLDRLARLNEQMKIVDLSSGIQMRTFEEDDHDEEQHTDEDGHEEEVHSDGEEHEHAGGVDPHTWLSPINLMAMTTTIQQAFVGADAVNAEFYEQQGDAVRTKLASLDTRIRNLLDDADNRQILVYHDAWGYFGRDYSLDLLEIESRGKEPTAAGIQAVIRQAREAGISVVFTSPEFPTQSAEVIASEINGRVVRISPLPRDIFDALDRVAQAFAEAL